MSVDIDAMFAGMAGAQMSGKGRKLGDGKYRVSAKSLKLKRGGYYGDTFIFEYDVTKSANADHPVGSGRSYSINLKSDYAMGDIKALIFALIMGKDPGQVSDLKRFAAEHAEAVEWFKAAIDPDTAKKKELPENFIEGLEVDVEVEWRKSEKTGKDWALHKWSPVPEAPAQAAA